MKDSNKKRQAAYKSRMRDKGFVQVTDWVPIAQRDLYREIANALREGIILSIGVTGDTEPKANSKPKPEVTGNTDLPPLEKMLRRKAKKNAERKTARKAARKAAREDKMGANAPVGACKAKDQASCKRSFEMADEYWMLGADDGSHARAAIIQRKQVSTDVPTVTYEHWSLILHNDETYIAGYVERTFNLNTGATGTWRFAPAIEGWTFISPPTGPVFWTPGWSDLPNDIAALKKILQRNHPDKRRGDVELYKLAAEKLAEVRNQDNADFVGKAQ